jgi:hypothetical protein
VEIFVAARTVLQEDAGGPLPPALQLSGVEGIVWPTSRARYLPQSDDAAAAGRCRGF